jgi:hypothetical protein
MVKIESFFYIEISWILGAFGAQKSIKSGPKHCGAAPLEHFFLHFCFNLIAGRVLGAKSSQK